jgi:hypothetical protein
VREKGSILAGVIEGVMCVDGCCCWGASTALAGQLQLETIDMVKAATGCGASI